MTINVLPIDVGVATPNANFVDLYACPADALFATINVRCVGYQAGDTLTIANVPLAFGGSDVPAASDLLRDGSVAADGEVVGHAIELKGLVLAAGRKIVVHAGAAGNAGNARAYGFLRRSV